MKEKDSSKLIPNVVVSRRESEGCSTEGEMLDGWTGNVNQETALLLLITLSPIESIHQLPVAKGLFKVWGRVQTVDYGVSASRLHVNITTKHNLRQ